MNCVRKKSKALDHSCAKRLKPNLVLMANHMTRHKQICVDEDTLRKIETISVSTLKRMLANTNKSKEKLVEKDSIKGNKTFNES